jgi:hypothetical protein
MVLIVILSAAQRLSIYSDQIRDPDLGLELGLGLCLGNMYAIYSIAV